MINHHSLSFIVAPNPTRRRIVLERVAAISAALGLPENVVGALPIVAAANLAMGIVPDENAALPAMVDCIKRALGLVQPATTAAPAVEASPMPAAAAAACGRRPRRRQRLLHARARHGHTAGVLARCKLQL